MSKRVEKCEEAQQEIPDLQKTVHINTQLMHSYQLNTHLQPWQRAAE